MSQPLLPSLPELADRLERRPRIILGLGFDGTLVPIAEHPAKVVLAPEVRSLLQKLAARDDIRLVVLSGRAHDELVRLIDVPAATCVGNHGLEISGPGLMFLEPTAAQFTEQIQHLYTELQTRLAGVPGAVIENKGLTLAAHYRTVPQAWHEPFRKLVHGALAAASHPFLLHEGRCVFEVRPRTYWHKGHALNWVRENTGSENALTLYAGDDSSDEEAFQSIADGITIKVGEPQGTAAQFVVAGPKEVHEFLGWLLDQLGRPERGPR